MTNSESKVIKEKDIVIVEGAIIKQVSSPSTIQRIAVDKGINPQEVYVRVTFEYKGEEFGVSNKLRFLTKAGYEELIKAKEAKTAMKLAVDKNSEFFYIEKDINVDDLFKTPVVKTNTRKSLATLLV
jgi:hypothetical protein